MSAEPMPKIADFDKPFPRVSITANVSTDGKRITLVFPQDYIKENIAVAGDNNGRHRILFAPVYGGQDIVGFVSPGGVKYGKVEIQPAAIGLKNVIPCKTGRYWGKLRDTDILVGRLLSDLCTVEEGQIVSARPNDEAKKKAEPIFREIPRHIPEIQDVKVTQVIEPTIEQCVDFVNEWVQKNNGVLVVEDNVLAIEIQKRIGGKKNG